MGVEIIGILPHRFYSEVYARPLSEFDTDFLESCALAHESAGFDRVLIANSSTYPDSLPVGTWVLSRTRKLKVMLAHRPGFVAPTMAARMFATVDRLSGGRCGVHIITGTNDTEMAADGEVLGKDERYERSGEYVAIMKRIWTSHTPIDHNGAYYSFKGGLAAVRPERAGAIPVFWGGASEKGLRIGSEVADVFALNLGPAEWLAETIARLHSFAENAQRRLELLISSRIVIGDSEEQAWELAHEHLRALVRELDENGKLEYQVGESSEAAQQRIFEKALSGSRQGLLFSAFGKVGVGRPIGNCLVGTVDQIVARLLELHGQGVSRFILAGYDPTTYPDEFGRELIPRLRASFDAVKGQGEAQ